MPFFTNVGEQSYTKYANNTNQKWTKDKGLRWNAFIVASLFAAQVCGGYDKSLISSLQAFSSWKLAMGSPVTNTLGLITASLNLGSLVTAPIVAFLMDKYGRKLAMYIGCVFMIIGTILQTAANGKGMFIAGRVLIGAGTAATSVCVPVFTQELAHPRQRSMLGALYNTTWYIGAIIVTWTCFGTAHMVATSNWGWRLPCLLQCIPCVYLLCVLWKFPDSPRFLISKGRNEEALKILADLHSNGDQTDEMVLYEFEEIKETIELELSQDIPWSRCLDTPGNRKRFTLVTCVSIFSNWSGQSIVTYYLTSILALVGVTGTVRQTGLNGGLQIFNWMTSMLGAMLAQRTGRRKLFLASFCGMLVANVLMGGLSASYAKHATAGVGIGVVVAIFLYDFAFNIACNPLLYIYETEIMTYHLRAKGLSWSVSFGGVQGILTQYTTPIALAKLKFKLYYMYTGLLCLWIAGVYFFFIETRGRSLEEVAAILDGEEVVKDIEAMGQRGVKEIQSSEKADSETKVNVLES